jgi:CRP-like cAMP-binding protein
MFSRISEQYLHWTRWILTGAWLIIIGSLFYDPWTPVLTQSSHPWSALRLTDNCILLQGECLKETPYALATTLFWGAIVPGAIWILLVFGHEVWRRICPLSFLSQIPRALGWQRQFKRESTSGKVRYELAKVRSDSWLGRNYPYLQFAWLFAGLCGRILFFNSDRLVLAGWLLFTIAAAITIGYLYGGKSWCNYFCPMAPVQKIYSMPSSLLGSKAHTSTQTITQSMCRIVLPGGKEQSACVACQNHCIDIDAERAYWDNLNRPVESFLRYGYIGLVIGYFVYYYLYAGNWDYYFSGAWARQPDQLASLLSPGFYVLGQAFNMPKLVAVPLTLGLFTFLGYQVGRWLEQRVKTYSQRQFSSISPEVVKHRIFTLGTFGVFNFFFIFGGRPLIQLLPLWIQYIYEASLVLLSTLWAYRTWQRSPDMYSRENLANRFRKQLEKLELDVDQLLEGRSLKDLNIHEVYILARVLPSFTRDKRRTAYRGVVREALQEGYVNYSSSLEVLQQLRQELGITGDEHREVIEELGIEDPELLNPDRQRSLENQVRLSGYQKSLERLMLLQKQQGMSNLNAFLAQNSIEVRNLRRQYSIAPQEEAWILSGIAPEVGNIRRAEFLLAQLPDLISCYRVLNQPLLQKHQAVLRLLRDSIHHKKELIIRTILEILAVLQNDPAATVLSQQLGSLSPSVLLELLTQEDWSQSLHSEVLQELSLLRGQSSACSLAYTIGEMLPSIELLLYDQNPLVQTASLYLITQLNLQRGQSLAHNHQDSLPILQQTAKIILAMSTPECSLINFPYLEKAVYLFNSDFFHQMHSETLIALADQATVKIYSNNEVITAAGDTCRELVLLIAGEAQICFHLPDQSIVVENLRIGQTLDELEVLAHSDSKNTITASSDITRILAVPVNAFDDLLELDQDFARRVLELESRHLQRFVRSLQSL